jgi:hypothetical protein
MRNNIAIFLISILLLSCLYEKGGIIDPVGTNTNTDVNGVPIDNTSDTSSISTPTSVSNDFCDLVSGSTTTTTNASGLICFDTQVLPLIVSNCATSGCHDSKSKKEGYELISYATITKKGVKAGNAGSSKIYTVLSSTGEKRMPPLPKASFTAEQKKLIADWINQGAKNIVCIDNTSGGILPDSVQISYSNHLLPILKNQCIGCHSSGSASGGINLDNYNAVLTVAKNGKLYGSIAQQSGYVAMPVGSKLSDCQIMAFKNWIAKGALNN